MLKPIKKIAVFASGAGSNAQKIIGYFAAKKSAEVALVVCNKPGAGVLAIAQANHIPVLMIEKEQFFRGDAYAGELKRAGIDCIVLAGFLWKIPLVLIDTFPGQIINIHPALLPKYGGKGMYGTHVHQAVVDNKETESGITIHYVDGQYDHGAIIFQVSCPVLPMDTAADVAQKVHALEHRYFAETVERVLSGLE